MGVLGLARLLKEEGWLPTDTSCIKSLWRANGISDKARISRLPPHSTLALDGNGLAHYLHHVAYSRYFDQVTGGPTSSSTTSCCCRTKNLAQTQVTRLLPQFMPLTILEEVTQEFVQSLERNQMKLVVYWDGEGRRMKAGTTSKRRECRDTEWSHLRQYCTYGVVPHSSSALCRKDWLQNFPLTRLFIHQIQFTLRQVPTVVMIQCEEEADREVAKASAENENCYCVGMDSDYFFFPNTKYVPLNTLNSSGSVVSGCVITRGELADHLGLPCEAAMVEFAILMGNDYVGNSKEAKLDFMSQNAEEIMDHLREKGSEYRVTSALLQVQLAIAFTRAFYEFEDLSDFSLDEESSDEEEESDEEEDSDDEDVDEELNRPLIPARMNLSLAAPGPLDFSVFNVVARPIETYNGIIKMEGRSLIQPEHLNAFKQVAEELQKQPHPQLKDIDIARPVWNDVLAAYIIERTISFVFRRYPSSPLVRISSPSTSFNHALFHTLLKNEAKKEPPVPPARSNGSHFDEPKEVERPNLPIDEHEAAILESVENQRVTIIHGETGCGKSSRVPVMLLRAPPPDASFRGVMMFISQPRRIAAKSLVERVRSCEPDLRLSIALRMGHGVREYETSQTRAWFVTTGYLVRLLANHPEKFNECSHLIIDEVHERSVDTDILCLLCRRLLDTNRRIRLILMSATMAASLYQEYFGVPQPPIHVGARRFPIKEYYVEDLMKKFSLPASVEKSVSSIVKDCEKTRCKAPPNNNHMDNLFKLSARLTMCVGRPGSSILIFVPGMNEIISITEQIEGLYVPGIRFTCYPIHSDVPFEEQMMAFDSPSADEVKVVIATNAAESSVTLPDVDHVICLGLCKQIMYNASSHRQMLMPAWISRASAIQRAGRTGRVRKGNVYRLYTRAAFEKCMDLFETGEMLRVPLDSVILTLKEMLREDATPVLLQCLEPPDLSTIQRSFQSLCRSNFISSPDDAGQITTLGKFVSALGIDLALGSFIGLGIQLGVGAEAVEMAAILSFPKTPWAMTSPLWHDPPEFNDISAKTFSSRCHFDANLYSEPLAIMNLLWDYERAKNQHGWAWHYSVSAPRLRRLVATRNSLRTRVAKFAGIYSESLFIEKPPVQMEHSKVTLLRILQVWVFSETMIESIQAASTVNGAVTLRLKGDRVSASHLDQVLDPERHPFSLCGHTEIDQSGTFTPLSDEAFCMDTFSPDFEARFLSFAVEKGLDVFCFSTESSFQLYAPTRSTESNDFVRDFRGSRFARFNESHVTAKPSQGKRRGRKERPCGIWDVQVSEDRDHESTGEVVHLSKWFTYHIDETSKRHLLHHLLDLQTVNKTVDCTFSKYKSKKGSRSPTVSLVSRGQVVEVSKVDLCDLFATPKVSVQARKIQSTQQKIMFSPTINTPIISYRGKAESATGDHSPESSWHRPLLLDMPEGARLLSVLASGRRKEHSILFTPLKTEESSDDVLAYLQVSLDRDESKISQRWKQFGSDNNVYVNENSVPAAALSMQGPIEILACCANTLEVKGGGLRVEGLTLLPPGRLFTLLSYLTFGLRPYSSCEIKGEMWGDEIDEEWSGEENDNEALISKALGWLNEWDAHVAGIDMTQPHRSPDIDRVERILLAKKFHESCAELGESLVCYPNKVRNLCKIFDMIDGYSVVPWENLDDNPFTEENLRKPKVQQEPRKLQKVMTVAAASVDGHTESMLTPKLKKDTNFDKKESATPAKTPEKRHASTAPYRVTDIVDTFSDQLVSTTGRLFAVTLKPGESVGEWDLPSTNILCVLVRHYCDFLLQKSLMLDDNEEIEFESQVSLTDRHWLIRTVKDYNGKKDWFLAEFVGTIMPFLSLKKRGRKLASWIGQGRARPSSAKHALDCVPPHFSSIPRYTVKVAFSECESSKAVFFESLEMALRMEAAFWLERQFGDSSRHWYQLSLEEMMTKATTLETVVPREA